jgi:hypothetical protein
VPAAVNQALRNARELHAELMRSMTDGLELPGLQDAISKFANLGDLQDDSKSP